RSNTTSCIWQKKVFHRSIAAKGRKSDESDESDVKKSGAVESQNRSRKTGESRFKGCAIIKVAVNTLLPTSACTATSANLSWSTSNRKRAPSRVRRLPGARQSSAHRTCAPTATRAKPKSSKHCPEPRRSCLKDHPSGPNGLMSSLSFLLCHPKAEAAELIVI